MENGKEAKIPFLHASKIETRYQNGKNFEMVAIPMRAGSFIIVLPKEGHTVQELLEQNILLKTDEDDGWESVEAEIRMPDFTQSSRIELLPVLNALGYHEISKYQVGYEKLVGKSVDGSSKECSVSQVLQESKIEVKKDGMEAASYTKVDIELKSAPMEEVKKITMSVNRPYLYMVIGRNGLPSFIGVNQEF